MTPRILFSTVLTVCTVVLFELIREAGSLAAALPLAISFGLGVHSLRLAIFLRNNNGADRREDRRMW